MKYLFSIWLLSSALLASAQIKSLSFESAKLQQKREIYVSLPASYDKNPNKRYPLLLVLDGDYLLNPFVSCLNYAALWNELPELIVVGISQADSQQRSLDCGLDLQTGQPQQKSIAFFDFISLELIPSITRQYRTSNFKIIAGHEQTAAFSHLFLQQEQPLFQAYIAMSPELPQNMENELPELLSNHKQSLFYYLATADGDDKKIQEQLKGLDSKMEGLNKGNLLYGFDNFTNASHFSLVLQAIPKSLYHIFNVAQPISVLEYQTKIVTLQQGYVDYLKKKYEKIENYYGLKNSIRITDFQAIEAAILENKDYNELDALAIMADQNYPKSMLSDYLLAQLFENKADYQRAVRYYMSGFNKEEIGDLTKNMLYSKAEALKKNFVPKPKIKGKVGLDSQ